MELALEIGEGYERHVGHWSRPVARKFLAFLEPKEDARWLDAGCGPGALSQHRQEKLRDRLEKSLPRQKDGSIAHLARAFAVKGKNASA